MSGRRWKATGKVEQAWLRLDPPTRDELARRLGLKAPTNISKLNTGDLWMTETYATRICRVVPGLSLMDLGAPEVVVAELEPLAYDRLQLLADDLAKATKAQTTMTRQIRQLRDRVRQLEARPWPAEAPSMGQAESL